MHIKIGEKAEVGLTVLEGVQAKHHICTKKIEKLHRFVEGTLSN